MHNTATNAFSLGQSTAYSRLLQYLVWAQNSARTLKNVVSAADLTTLVLTPRHDTLLEGVGHLAGSSQERLVNLLVNQELEDRIQSLEAAITFIQDQAVRWGGRERSVAADSSFYIQNPDKLADADLHQILRLPPAEHIRLLFPIVVVDELDGLKESGKHRSRWRAAHTLGQLDGALNGRTSGILRVRLPIADDEIIDRAVAIKGRVRPRCPTPYVRHKPAHPRLRGRPERHEGPDEGPWPGTRLGRPGQARQRYARAGPVTARVSVGRRPAKAQA
ncbi:hypothetical protein ABT272_37430 [Streptomyces sp900105245]|uniref:PIN domain-containing protein n=1 Tax=Streptomyces sp. 900105245 TaxID=3154379 RepID=A0ABV1UI15_9ACTN